MNHNIGDEIVYKDEPFIILGLENKENASGQVELFLTIEGIKTMKVLEISESEMTGKKPSKNKKITKPKKTNVSTKSRSNKKQTVIKKPEDLNLASNEVVKENGNVLTEETPIASVNHDVFKKQEQVVKQIEPSKWLKKSIKRTNAYKGKKVSWQQKPYRLPSKIVIHKAFEYNKFLRPCNNRFIRTCPVKLKAPSKYYKTSKLPMANKIGVINSPHLIDGQQNATFVAPITPEPIMPVIENPLPLKKDYKNVKNDKLLNVVIVSDKDNLIMEEISNKDSWYDQITELSLDNKTTNNKNN